MQTEDNKATKPPIILDTNILISAIIFPGDVTRQILLQGFREYRVVFSDETWDEFAVVMQRQEFERRLPLRERLLALEGIALRSEVISVPAGVTDCRDAKDNKFLDLALSTQASCIVTGDKDLLDLHPWRGVNILTPSDFIANEK